MRLFFPVAVQLSWGILVSATSATLGWATALTVPDAAPSIQAALNAAPDTVLVRPGAYSETPIISRDVCVLGTQVGSEGMPQVSGLTIQPLVPANVIKFVGIAVLAKVTIDNEYASCHIVFDACRLMTGIADISRYIDTIDITLSRCTLGGSSQLVMRNACVIDSCDVTGEIFVGDFDPRLTVRGSSFHGQGDGASITTYLSSHILIDGNTIKGYAVGIDVGTDGDAIITNNVVEDCWDKGIGISRAGGIVANNVARRCGGGIEVSAERLMEISANTVEYCSRRGLLADAISRETRVVRNVVHHCLGDGIEILGEPGYSSIYLIGNTSAYNDGSGILWDVAAGSNAELVGNIAYANGRYGMFSGTYYVTRVACNDWFDNSAGDFAGGPPSLDDVSIQPQFCGATTGDFHLLASSPLANWPGCGQVGALGIGCGVTSTVVTRFAATRVSDGIRIIWELDTSSGPFDAWLERSPESDGPWHRPITTVSHEGRATVELDRTATSEEALWYRLRVRDGGAIVVAGDPIKVDGVRALRFGIDRVGPNPSFGQVRIEFALAREAMIEIDIFDVHGRVVASPAHGTWSAGMHSVAWLGASRGSTAPAGTYLNSFQ